MSFQTLKVLRTSEFLPYVVFLQSPEFEVLKAMNHSAVEAGVVAKTLTVSKPLLHTWTRATVYMLITNEVQRIKTSPVFCPRMKSCTGRATRARKYKQPTATTLTSPSSTTTWMRPTAQSRPPWRQSLRIHSGSQSPGCFREMQSTSHCVNIEGPCLRFPHKSIHSSCVALVNRV